MDGLILAAAVLLLAAFVAAPLYRRTTGPGPASAPATAHALRDGASDRLDTALADLEVDLASGLIDRATYERERAALLLPD